VCGGKTIPRWRTAAILKIDISPYLEKSSDFYDVIKQEAQLSQIYRAMLHVIEDLAKSLKTTQGNSK